MKIDVDILTISISNNTNAFKQECKESLHCKLNRNRFIAVLQELIGVQPYCSNFDSISEYWKSDGGKINNSQGDTA